MERAERLAVAVLFGVILMWATLSVLHAGVALRGPACFELMLAQSTTGATWTPAPHSQENCNAAQFCSTYDCNG
jgi:hypothetical protein